MTVIAWDGKTLAADKRACNSGLIRTVTKIRKVGGLLCGSAGGFSEACQMMEWIENGRVATDFPDCQKDKDDWAATIVIEAGRILKYERSPVALAYEDGQFAIGSGRDFALMAMRLGKTAREAVELTSEFEAGCGNGVDEIS